MAFPEFTDETHILPASKAFVLFWAERISVPFTTFGYRQITFLSTYPWETYSKFALLTFLSVCACVCSILCFSVHLFSVVSEISPATPPKGSPLRVHPHRWDHVTPTHHIVSSLPEMPLFLDTLQDPLLPRCRYRWAFSKPCIHVYSSQHLTAPIIGLWPHAIA